MAPKAKLDPGGLTPRRDRGPYARVYDYLMGSSDIAERRDTFLALVPQRYLTPPTPPVPPTEDPADES